jgi:hypothetical protein
MRASPESCAASVIPTSLGSTSLLKVKLSVPLKSLAARQLSGHRDLELMLAGRDVPGVDPLDAPLLEGIQLLEAVDVMRDGFSVDLDPHRVEPEALSLCQGDEEGELGVGRIEEFLLEAAQLRGDAQDVGLDLLDLLVQALHLLLGDLAGDGSCDARRAADPDQQGENDGPENPAGTRDPTAILPPAAPRARHNPEVVASRTHHRGEGCHG